MCANYERRTQPIYPLRGTKQTSKQESPFFLYTTTIPLLLSNIQTMAQQARGIGDQAGPDAWFRALPVVTRYWFGGSIFCTLAVNFEIISGHLIPFVWENVSSKLELWRLLSCFLYVGPVRWCGQRGKDSNNTACTFANYDDDVDVNITTLLFAPSHQPMFCLGNANLTV